MNDEDDILSAEMALGLLDGAEHDAARRRLAADPALAQRVDWWRDRFEPLSGTDQAEPSAGLWPRIDAMLPRNDNTASQVRRWRAAAFAAMLVAVVMGTAMALRPVPTLVAPPPATTRCADMPPNTATECRLQLALRAAPIRLLSPAKRGNTSGRKISPLPLPRSGMECSRRFLGE